jgi:hypothetical protein
VHEAFKDIDKSLEELQEVVTKMLVEVGVMRLQLTLLKELRSE